MCPKFVFMHATNRSRYFIVTVDLIKDGRTIFVTKDNIDEYIRCIVRYRLFGGIHKQIEAMLQGFLRVLPQEILSVFDFREFELLMVRLKFILLLQLCFYIES